MTAAPGSRSNTAFDNPLAPRRRWPFSERAYGAFQRSFALTNGVDRDKIAADLSKGVLKITLPKTAEAQESQKKIEVKAAT
jgi:HSP20 family protein